MSSMIRISLLFLVYLNSINSAEIQCKKDNTEFDAVLSDYFLFASPTRKFPTDQVEMKKFCKENTVFATKIKNYSNKCMDKLLKRLSSLAVYSVEKTNSNICKSRRRSAEMMEMSKCGNSVNKGNQKCWNNWMKDSSAISFITDSNLRIPLVCCTSYTMKNCFAQNYEKNKNCNKKSSDGLENLFGSYLTDTLKIMCGDYTEDNDKCDRIYSQIPQNNTKKAKGSLISILFAIFEDVPE